MTDTAQEKQEEKRSQKSLVILIVEDDPILARLYTEKFNLEGFNVLIAPDGDLGLQLATEKNPDFILLDMMLPKHDGLWVLRQLADHPRAKHIPIVALSNLTDKTHAHKAMRLGVKEYMAKAMYTPEQVVEKVKSYLPHTES